MFTITYVRHIAGIDQKGRPTGVSNKSISEEELDTLKNTDGVYIRELKDEAGKLLIEEYKEVIA
ncbi:MAG: hypothetical protein ACQEWW_07795 [Bacillota bacterium]